MLDAFERDVGDADEVELALLAHVLEDAELLRQRDVRAAVVAQQPQVDEVHPLDAQRAQVGLHAGAQLVGGERRQPAAAVVATGADLGHELEALGVGMQRLADQVVDDVGAVVLRGVDVVDAQLDRAAQDRAGGVGVAGRAEDAGPGELHRAEADAVDGLVAQE